jgi:hypothetical protein
MWRSHPGRDRRCPRRYPAAAVRPPRPWRRSGCGAGEPAHRPGSVGGRPLRTCPEQPSIWTTRCRAVHATYPQARAGSPPATVAGRLACADHRSEPAALLGLAPGGVYPAVPVARDAGGLLHHRFTLTRTPTGAGAAGGLSLWHCPASYPGWELPTTSPCGARTFLDRHRRETASTAAARPARPRRESIAGAGRDLCPVGQWCPGPS